MKRGNRAFGRAVMALAAFAVGLGAAPAFAQDVGDNPQVRVENASDETRKICFHKPKTVTLFPIGCVTLEPGESILWNRKGNFSPFKVKVYEDRKMLDKYLYSRDLPGDTGKIIVSEGFRFGFSRFKNITRSYSVRVCNTSQDDDVWFSLGYDMAGSLMSEGWWSVKRDECKTIQVTKNLKDKWGLNTRSAPRVHYYARTYGEKPLFWSDKAGSVRFCLNKGKRFKGEVADSNQCGQDQTLAAFRFLKQPDGGRNEQMFLTF